MLSKLALLFDYGITSRIRTSDNSDTIGVRLNRILVKRIFMYCGRQVIVKPRARFGRGSQVSIGDNSMIGEDCIIGSTAEVVIGHGVLMGPQVIIYTQNHGMALGIPMRLQPACPAPVHIGDHCCPVKSRIDSVGWR